MTVSMPPDSPMPPAPAEGDGTVVAMSDPQLQNVPVDAMDETPVAVLPVTVLPAARGGFFQQPWVQHVLPFATSLTLHLALIIIGYATYKTVQRAVEVVQEQIIIPESTMADSGPPGGLSKAGLGADPTRDAAQDLQDLAPDVQNWAKKTSDNLNNAVLGGNEADAAAMIGVGANAPHESGEGAMDRMGNDSSGQLAPFGVPGGGEGANGPKSNFAGVGGNARKIVYICQASGSMLSVWDDLRRELDRSIEALQPVQAFDVIFFSEDNVYAFDNSALQMATPENKRKAYDFIKKMYPRGDTNPVASIDLAMGLKPELVYILGDGFYKVSSFDDVTNAFRRGNLDKHAHINCIYLQSDDDPKLLQVLRQIVKENNGKLKITSKTDF